MRRWGRAPLLVGLLVLANSAFVPLAARADAADTWTGTWARKELDGNLILEQNGTSVTGSYTWNDASGRVGAAASGDELSGSFNETHYQGTFDLTRHGKTFTGSYDATNKDSGADSTGPFTGTCIAGPCLGNGGGSGSGPSSSSPSSTTTSTTLADPDAERALQAAMAGGDVTTVVDAAKGLVANAGDATQYGEDVESKFLGLFDTRADANSTLDEAARLMGQAASLAAYQRADGAPQFPGLTAALPVIGNLLMHAGQAVDGDDDATGQGYLQTAKRLIALLLGDAVHR